MSKEIIEVAEGLHSILESLADGKTPSQELYDDDLSHWYMAKAYSDLRLVAGYIRMLLSDSPTLMGPMSPILGALLGEEMEDELE
jgi:hypothetical protein